MTDKRLINLIAYGGLALVILVILTLPVGAAVLNCPPPTPTPMAVYVLRFQAAQRFGVVYLEWETANEVFALGFNLYSGPTKDGKRTKLNAEMIPAQGLGSPIGFVYNWTDPNPEAFYWLEAIDIYNWSTMYGPIPALSNTSE